MSDSDWLAEIGNGERGQSCLRIVASEDPNVIYVQVHSYLLNRTLYEIPATPYDCVSLARGLLEGAESALRQEPNEP